MAFAHTINGTTHQFKDLKDLLAKATPARSGDELAGVAASSEIERAAAKFALADVPLKHFLNESVIPYEEDEVTRLILDTHDAAAFTRVAHMTVGELQYSWKSVIALIGTSACVSDKNFGLYGGNRFQSYFTSLV